MESNTLSADARPYRASLLDRFLDWLDGLPLPNWTLPILVYLLNLVLFLALAWSAGTVPPGELAPELLFHPLWLPVGIGLFLLWDRMAERALADFAPALNASAEELEEIRYRLTTMPLGITELIAALAPALILLGFIPLEGGGPIYFPEAGGLWLVMVALIMVAYAMLPLLLYHSVRQLRLVSELHSRVEAINLFRLQPLFAFSKLTAVTGVGWIVLIQMNLISILIAEQGAAGSETLASGLVIIAIQIVFAVLAFALPLWGVHRRLVQAKDRALSELMSRLETCYRAVNRAVDEGDFSVDDRVGRTLDLLNAQKDQLKAISTWPWQAGTLRGFASALLLPVVLWFVQQLLSQALWGG